MLSIVFFRTAIILVMILIVDSWRKAATVDKRRSKRPVQKLKKPRSMSIPDKNAATNASKNPALSRKKLESTRIGDAHGKTVKDRVKVHDGVDPYFAKADDTLNLDAQMDGNNNKKKKDHPFVVIDTMPPAVRPILYCEIFDKPKSMRK